MDDSFFHLLLASGLILAEATSPSHVATSTSYGILSVRDDLPVDDASASEGASCSFQGNSAGSTRPSSEGVSGNVYPNPNENNTSPPGTMSASAVVPPALPCGLSRNVPCTQPLHGTSTSIREHLRMHMHKHHERELILCPWTGCSEELRWMNIPRHNRSVHLRVRIPCPYCGKGFTRSLGLKKHIRSQKCPSYNSQNLAAGDSLH